MVRVRLQGRRDLARQVYLQLRAAILGGRLKRGERLPPSRELARRLDVSRNTVGFAYEWLVTDGLLSGRRGAGSYVESRAAPRATRREGAQVRRRAAWDLISLPFRRDFAPPFNFGVGIPDTTLFPFDTWRRLVAREIHGSPLDTDYGDPAGHPRLRAALARHVAVSRGVSAAAEDVIVTNGAQGAFDLIARVLLEPGALVAVEEPGYPPARLLFESYGARVAAVPVDAAGLDVGRLPEGVRLVYVTPSHQFPLGMPMSHPRRIALLEWAERRNAVVVEDDYDSELRFGGRPLEMLQAIDRRGRVVHVGSFSKSLLPALRLGYLVAPSLLRPAVQAASYVAGGFVQWPAHAALATLIESGLLARHVRKIRRAYAARHERILRTLERDFAEWLVPVPSVTGLHLAARMRSRDIRLEEEVADRARRDGVRFDRLSAYCASAAPQTGVVLGYGAVPEPKIDEGLRRLRRCFAAAV